jgi:hypothetical protein
MPAPLLSFHPDHCHQVRFGAGPPGSSRQGPRSLCRNRCIAGWRGRPTAPLWQVGLAARSWPTGVTDRPIVPQAARFDP